MKDGNHSAKVVGKLLRRKTISFQGTPLTPRDSALMRLSLEVQGALLLDLLPNDDASRRWCAFLGEADLDVAALSDTIKYLDHVIKTYPSEYLSNDFLGECERVVRDVPGFKRQVRDRKLLWSFLAPVEAPLASYFKTLDAPSCALLNQWANFLSHVTLRDVDLKSTLLSEYVQLEQLEGEWIYESEDMHSLNRIMREWLSGFSLDGFVPSHGPGAVAELTSGTGRFAKYQCMTTDARLHYWISRLPVDVQDLMPPGGFLEGRSLTRTSELICVPKSMVKNRTISKEPCSLQYFQHGVQRRVDEYMQDHPVLSGRIDLHNQLLSKQLAQLGSIRGEWDTVDLSAASDSITYRLVKAIFAHTPLYRSLVCLRSDSTKLPSGEVLKLQKFAPMGSDLCFPTMCLVFACVCEQAVRNVAGRTSRLNDYRVYGDDIVLKHEFTPEVLRLLAKYHFEVNTRKSFTDQSLHNFREACGGEYLDGVEVTPLRISRRLRVEVDGDEYVSSVESVSSYTELINSMFAKGYYNSRLCLMRNLDRLFLEYDKLPYTSEMPLLQSRYGRSCYSFPTYSTAIVTFPWCCTNFRVPTRFHGANGRPGLQVRQAYALIPTTKHTDRVSKYRDYYTSEDVRYFEYWLTLPDRPYGNEFGVETTPEPLSGLYPARPTWREKWVSAIS